MIAQLRGWTRTYSGDSITLIPPEGPALGAIRYRERVRPLARAGHVVAGLLSRTPQLEVSTSGKPEMIVTREGEYGALVKVSGTLAGAPAQRDFGFVFGDDFYALVSAISLAPEKFTEYTELVRLLTVGDSHALGVRRRRFLYTPPPAWPGRARGGMSEWLPPDFPRNLSLIQVFPANPVLEPAEAMLEQMLVEDKAGGFVLEAMRGPESIASTHGLAGLAWNIVGRFGDRPRSHRDLVVFKDPRFLYALRLETMQEERSAERQVFLDVARSAQPIPAPSTVEPKEVNVLVNHWAL